MSEAGRPTNDDAVLQWLLTRQDLPPEQLSEVLRQWKQETPGSKPALASVLIAAGHLKPEELPEILSTPAPTSVRLPEKASEALRDTARWFGPSIDAGLPKYLLVKLLGEGGMGEVHLAYQTDLERWVALKFLKNRDEVDRQRFLREARTAGGLGHPNIVAVHDVGEWEGRSFISMEYVEGTDLRRRRVEPKEACAFVRDAARALDYAHRQGVIHRDVKPQNLLITEAGRIYVTDFGLARSLQPSDGRSLTMSGEILGTPSYMAPEQARGEHGTIDGRADVYGLGATLYWLVTGRAPFEGGGVWDIVNAVLTQDPVPPRKHNPKLDRELDVIILKCLEKEPARRYADAGALAEDLDRYLGGSDILAVAPSIRDRLVRRIKRKPLLSFAFALVALLTVAGGALGLYSLWMKRENYVVNVSLPTVQALVTAWETMEMPLDLLPDVYRIKPRQTGRDLDVERTSEETVRDAASSHTMYDARLYRAAIHLGSGEYEQGRRILEQLDKPQRGWHPDRYWLYRGFAREMTGEAAGALADYAKAAGLARPSVAVQSLLRAAEIHVRAKRIAEAKALLLQVSGSLKGGEPGISPLLPSKIRDRLAALDGL